MRCAAKVHDFCSECVVLQKLVCYKKKNVSQCCQTQATEGKEYINWSADGMCQMSRELCRVAMAGGTLCG